MKALPISILTIFALVASACGGNEADTSSSAEGSAPAKAVKAEKFKGSKHAPSQDIINATVGDEWFERRGFGLKSVGNGTECKGAVSYLPEKWSPECAGAVRDFKARIAFTPSECRKGDERVGYGGVLINPVSCTGLLEDPRGQEKRVFVFHQPDGEWKAWIGPDFPGTRKNR